MESQGHVQGQVLVHPHQVFGQMVPSQGRDQDHTQGRQSEEHHGLLEEGHIQAQDRDHLQDQDLVHVQNQDQDQNHLPHILMVFKQVLILKTIQSHMIL